ncbi:MAG: AMP-binding protein [Verrucomicrobiales bacterium]|nr:AMP-binding protein [Verrucomicrobiales bacterium]
MRLTDRLTSHWDSLEAEELRELQGRRLRHFLKDHVVPFSGYYGKAFREAGIDPDAIRSLDDLVRIPFSSKRTLISDDDGSALTRDFVLVPDEKVLARRTSTIVKALYRGRRGVKTDFEREYRPILMTSTTGRSADPIPFLYSRHDLDNLALTGRRLMEVCDSSPDFRHINLFPFAPHLAFWQAHYAGLGYNTFTLSTGGGKVMGTEGNVRLLEKINPDALIGMPTFIYHVLHVAAEQGVICPKIQRIVLGGEKVPAGLRHKLRSLCAELGSGKVEVMATYGFTEAKMAYPECPARGGSSTGYHLYPDLGVIEVIDPESGNLVPEGEPGEIVFTPLDSRGSVVLRYRTGDLISGGLTYEPCPACGRSMPRLLGRISRVSDVRRMNIGKVKGTLVNFNDLEHVLDDLTEVGSWQIELRKRNNDPLESDEIVVHVAPTERTDAEALEYRISDRFAAATEIRPNRIEFHDAADLRKRQGVGIALKEEKVIDRRKEAGIPKEEISTPVSHHESI